MTITGTKSHILFVIFLDSYSMVGIGEVQLGKLLARTNQSNNLLIRDKGYQFLIMKLLGPQ